IASLVPISAGARLLEAAPRVSLDGVAQVNFPRRQGAIDPAAVPFVGEMAPIPVLQFLLNTVPLGPARKLAALAVATRELIEGGNGEQVINTLLRENAAASLDAVLFSNVAADATRPAGTLNGVAPLTPTAGGSDAMATDLGALAGEVSKVSASL